MLGKYISQKMDKDIMPQTACLPCEDIAAFVDDRLDMGNRERVKMHLADCLECYRLYADTIAAKLIATGRADSPTTEKRTVKALLYIVPTALAACLALMVFSGNFKGAAPGGTAPAEMKMPAGSTLPVAEIIKKKDGFTNMTGQQGKR